MDIKKYLEICGIFEKLKCTTRHCVTSTGRQESVAEHSHRIAVMAYLCKDEFPTVDINRVILMCLFHDLGEAFTGDIPCFEKTEGHETVEDEKVSLFLNALPSPYKEELTELFDEMERLETTEAKLYKAIDHMEAVIQHNESDIATWLPLEYDLQLTYGTESTAFSDYTKRLKEECNRITKEKIANRKK